MVSASDRIAGALAVLMLGAALFVLPPAATAQQASPSGQAAPTEAAPATPAPGSTAATRPRRRVDRLEAHIKTLHDQLKITPEQEPKWEAVARTMRENARTIRRLSRERAAKRGKMNAVEDLKSYEAIADAHADNLKQLVPAFTALYDSMSDAQKKNADSVFSHRSRTPRHRHAAAHHG